MRKMICSIIMCMVLSGCGQRKTVDTIEKGTLTAVLTQTNEGCS